MITVIVQGDILKGPHKNIVFAVNSEGYNDSGFAGHVSKNYWPELANTGGNTLGSVFSKTVGNRTFHALVCHSLEEGGWEDTPHYIQICLAKLQVPTDTELATLSIGDGPVGRDNGANVKKNMKVFERSLRKFAVYKL